MNRHKDSGCERVGVLRKGENVAGEEWQVLLETNISALPIQGTLWSLTHRRRLGPQPKPSLVTHCWVR